MDWKTLLGFTILFHAIIYAWKKTWILRLDTKKLNSLINGVSQHGIRKYFRIWFRLGTYVTLFVGFPFTLWLFLNTIYHTFIPSITTVATAVVTTPASLLGSSTEKELELHHEQLQPYPDAEIIGPSSSSSTAYLAIQPILPGWNLPLSHLPYYLLAILISVVIHELGHAVASASHRIPIVSMGVSLFGPLIPTAHVELNSAQLQDTKFKNQLDILTAGVWMNMYLALITYFVVPKILPAILFPTHSMGTGLVVTGVMPDSGVGGTNFKAPRHSSWLVITVLFQMMIPYHIIAGIGGLQQGDIIFGVEKCPVQDLNSWFTCLERIWETEPLGYCLDTARVRKYSNHSDNPGCCGPQADISATHLCFMEMTLHKKPHFSNRTRSLILDNIDKNLNVNKSGNTSSLLTSYCLPAKPVVTVNDSVIPKCIAPNYSCPLRKSSLTASSSDTHVNNHSAPSEDDKQHNEVVNETKSVDKNAEDVPKEQSEPGKEETSSGTHCYVPRIVKQFDRFRIVQIHRRQENTKESVLFVGDVRDLVAGIKTSEYIPRNWFLSRLVGFAKFSVLPVELETVLLLTAGLSAGLAVVNMLPIYGLDGYHVVFAIVRVRVGKSWESKQITRLVNLISWIALTVALVTIFCSMVNSF